MLGEVLIASGKMCVYVYMGIRMCTCVSNLCVFLYTFWSQFCVTIQAYPAPWGLARQSQLSICD